MRYYHVGYRVEYKNSDRLHSEVAFEITGMFDSLGFEQRVKDSKLGGYKSPIDKIMITGIYEFKNESEYSEHFKNIEWAKP